MHTVLIFQLIVLYRCTSSNCNVSCNCLQEWFGCNVCLSLYYSPKQMLFGILPSESWETPSIISCVDALYPHPTTVSIIRIIIKIKLNKIKKPQFIYILYAAPHNNKLDHRSRLALWPSFIYIFVSRTTGT